MNRTERVLELILRRAGKPLSETRLLKLAYLSDLVCWQVLGHPVSALEYRWHHFGPFDEGFYRARDALLETGRVREEVGTTAEGKDFTLLEALPGGEATDCFSRAELYLVSLTINRYRDLPLRLLLEQVVYQTRPMLNARKGEPLSMAAEKYTERDNVGGVSLETILQSRDELARGDAVSVDVLRAEFLGATK